MKEISMRKGVFQVSDEDYDEVMKFHWNLDGKGYVMKAKNKFGKPISLQRYLMKPPSNMLVDHIDGNPLNNQRDNLRICTKSQNNMNRPHQKNNTSGYKGVHKARNGKWASALQVSGQKIRLGEFENPEDAARAYDKTAKEYFGDFAKTNF